jgi:hypothetical protein
VYLVHLLVYLVESAPPEGQNFTKSRISHSDPVRLLWTYKPESGVFGMRPIYSDIQIHGAMPLKETVSEGLGHFQRFPAIS